MYIYFLYIYEDPIYATSNTKGRKLQTNLFIVRKALEPEREDSK